MFAWKPRREKKYTSFLWVFCSFAAALLGGLVIGFCSLYLASGKFGDEMFASYFDNLYILGLNLAVPLFLSAFFFLLTNRAVWSYLLTAVSVLVPTLVHYYKMEFRGDCLIAEDVSLITESKKMLESYDLFWDDRIELCVCAAAVGLILLVLFARGRFRRAWPRLCSAIALALAGYFALWPLYLNNRIYDTKAANHALINEYSESQQYISKGFVYPFLHSVKSALRPAPDGYDAAAAAAALAAYTDAEIPADRAVNLVCVMLEAYTDFSRFEELTFTSDIYEKYHALEEMGYSGTLITDIFAGDTRISEREFLTGLPYARLDNFVAPSNSYVWYLRENGYYTEGAHPCYAWFYNRAHINQNLGFENYYFTENYFKARTGGDITYDARFFPMLYDLYANRDPSKPYFSFNITYQGHGPYESDNAYFTEPYIENKGYPEADFTIVNNYLNSIAATTEYLYDYAMDMLAMEEPLVLVFFGDHKPWLGNSGAVYETLGINIDLATEEGFFNYYSTRYLILANDAAKKLCGSDFSGEGEPISVSFLMNKVFELCGYPGSAYMQLTSDILRSCPVIHRTDPMTEEPARLYNFVSYYFRRNFLYD